MRPAPIVLGLLLLAGCGPPGPTRGTTSPEVEACRKEAYGDPTYKLYDSIGAGTFSFWWQKHDQIDNAYNDAVLKCLRQRGLARGGGVERSRTP